MLSLSTILTFASAFFPGSSFLPQTDFVPLFWNLFTYTLLFFGSIVGLLQKYGLQSILNNWTQTQITNGIMNFLVKNFIPDFFLGVVPLYMTFLRLDQYRATTLDI